MPQEVEGGKEVGISNLPAGGPRAEYTIRFFQRNQL